MGDLIQVEFTYRGSPIGSRDKLISLTDMWRASGAGDGKKPAQWLKTDAASVFVDFVQGEYRHLDGFRAVTTEHGGNAPGTWAHWQVAMAYAKFLSPEFHAWANEVVRAHMDGKALAPLRSSEEFLASLVATQRETVAVLQDLHSGQRDLQAGQREIVETVRDHGQRLDRVERCLLVAVDHKRKTPRARDRAAAIAFVSSPRSCGGYGGLCPFCDAPIVVDGTFVGQIHHHEKASDAGPEAIMACCGPCNTSFNKRPAPRHTIDEYHARRARWTGPLFAKRAS